MLPTSVKNIEAFTPKALEGQPDAPIYFLTIPQTTGRNRYRRAITAAGIRIWPQSEMIASARAALAELQPQDAEEALEICDLFETLDQEEDTARRAIIISDWEKLARALTVPNSDFANRVADNQYFYAQAPIVAARCFLASAENPSLPFARGLDGMVTEESFEAIPEAHRVELGWKAISLLQPSEQDVKNSVSPRPLPSDPANSTAASKPRTAAPGISSVKSTRKTQS